MIRAAHRTLDIEQFYLSSPPGSSMEPVVAAVREAAERGVRVRLLLDAKFIRNYPNTLAAHPCIEVKTVDFARTDGVQHSKFFVVDESESFIGSANFDSLALSHIHEVGLRVSDRTTSEKLGRVFSMDWADGVRISAPTLSACAPSVPPETPTSPLRGANVIVSPPAHSPEGLGRTLDELKGLFAQARRTVKIQVYQYTTEVYRSSARWLELDAAIRSVASGVQVQILVDAIALKNGKNELRSLSQLPNVDVRAVTIPQWSGGPLQYARLIHSKYMTIDGERSWVGTENWSKGYFTSSRNVGLSIESNTVAAQLGEIFDRVWASSYARPL